MRKLFFLILVLLFVSGCASFTDFFKGLPGIKPPTSGGGKSFVGGTNSIALSILQPPESGKISKEVPLRVSVNVKNDGEALAEGQVCVTGLNTNVFEEAESCKCDEFSLKGKAKFEEETTEGENKVFNFDEGSATIDEFTINSFSVTSIARYSYKTYASVEGCVVKDILTSKDCKPRQDAKLVGVSSAPLQVTSVSQELLLTSEDEYSMTLFIEVAHKGNGQFFSTSITKDICGEEDSNINKNVEVKLFNAPGRASCNPLVFKKKEDIGTATCTVTGVEARDYKPMINIELSYTYEIRESNNFEVA